MPSTRSARSPRMTVPGLRRAPSRARLFRFRSALRYPGLEKVEFTGLGIVRALRRHPGVATNALTCFRESAPARNAFRCFSNACPPPRRAPQAAGGCGQARFSVIFLSRPEGNKPTWAGGEKCFPEPADRSILPAVSPLAVAVFASLPQHLVFDSGLASICC